VATAILWALCGGCLVTEEIPFDEEPNLPPVILSKPGEPEIGSIIWIDKSALPQWMLRVQVRDENVEQSLEAHFRIRRQIEMYPRFDSLPVPSATGTPLRDLDIFVDTAGLRDYECHRLELVVSGSFIAGLTTPEDFQFVMSEDQSDIAFASWWIWEGEGRDTPDANRLAVLESCVGFGEYLTAEPTLEEQQQ
jgi:hypothetical protein